MMALCLLSKVRSVPCHFSPLVHTLVPPMPARAGAANAMTAPEKDLVEAIPTMHLLLLLSAALQPLRAHDNPSTFPNAHALPSMPPSTAGF